MQNLDHLGGMGVGEPSRKNREGRWQKEGGGTVSLLRRPATMKKASRMIVQAVTCAKVYSESKGVLGKWTCGVSILRVALKHYSSMSR